MRSRLTFGMENVSDKFSPQNESYSIIDRSDAVEDVVLPIFYSLIVFVGIAGNSLVIIIVKKTPLMQTTTNLLLANLAVADLLALIGSIPNEILLQLQHPTGALGTYLCVFVSTGNTTVTCFFVSILVLAVLAIERFNGVVKPFDSNRALTKRKVALAVVVIWVISMACTIPLFIGTRYNPETGWCESTWNNTAILIYVSFVFVGFFLLSFIVISFSYSCVIRELYFKQERASESQSQSLKENDTCSKKRVVKLLLLVTGVFGLSFGTFGVCRFLFETDRINSIAYNISVLLLYSTCSVNPLIYAFQSPNYHKAFKEILCLHHDFVEMRSAERPRATTRPNHENTELNI